MIESFNMKENEVGAILGAGEVQRRREEVSETIFEYLKIKAKGDQKFLYTWSRKNDLVLGGKETFLVLSKDPPAFEPSLQYSVLHDPTA
jgi:hypothetical protein